MTPRISIIIVSYQATPLTHLCLWSLAVSNLKNSEVIVVDNTGNDPYLKTLHKHYPFLRIILNEQNEGFGKACNKGHQQARGEISVFLNPDTMVPSNFENQILTFFEKHPQCGAMGVRMLDATGRFLPESKRNLPNPASAFLKLTCLYHLIPHQKEYLQYYATQIRENQCEKTSVLAGACMAVNRKAMDQTGGFDPRFFMYSEDIDLSMQIAKSGFEVWYNPSIKIIHFKGETSSRSPKFSSMFFDSMQLFHQKHYAHKQSKLFFILTSYFIQTAKIFSFLKHSLKRRIPQKQISLFILHPNSSPRCIKKLQNPEYEVKVGDSRSKKSFLAVSSKEITPDQIIHMITDTKKLKNKILFLHEESGCLFQFNKKNELIRIFRLSNVK